MRVVFYAGLAFACGRSPADEVDIRHEGRVLRDLLSLRLDIVAKPSQEVWVLGQASGRVTTGLEGGQVDPATGKLVFPNGPRMVRSARGRCVRRSILAGKTDKEAWEYSWDLPMWGGRPSETESPLLRQNILVVAKLGESKEPPSPFTTVLEIPQAWEQHVAPAMELFRTAPSPLSPAGTLDPTALEKHLSNENPFVAFAVACRLAEADLLNWAAIKEPITLSKGMAQAALAVIALRYVPPRQGEGLRSDLDLRVAESKNSEELKGLSLAGAFVLNDDSTSEAPGRARKLLASISAKVPTSPVAPADIYIDQALKLAGVRVIPDPSPPPKK